MKIWNKFLKTRVHTLFFFKTTHKAEVVGESYFMVLIFSDTDDGLEPHLT